jgi:hypothetical protein
MIGYPVLRMLEIKSEKYKDLSYVLAAELLYHPLIDRENG